MSRILHPLRIYGILLLTGCCIPNLSGQQVTAVRDVPYEEHTIPAMPAVHIGGYGSSMAYHEADSTYWILTDRGPNVDGPTADSKIFVMPAYTPRIGVFKLRGDSLHLVRTVLLKDSMNVPYNGLPNPAGEGATGETAYDRNGHLIRQDNHRGLDPEGLALAPDGTFWISDEYGPYLLHFDGDGRCMETLSPYNGRLPATFAHRRPNRGLEGLCISRDGHTLYCIMQSPLRGRQKQPAPCVPLLSLHPTDGDWVQYAYPLENKDNGVSELAYVGGDTLFVLERDGRFPVGGRGFKRIYQISLRGADPSKPLHKELIVDLLKACPGYDHDKPEGMTLVGNGRLAVVNDDDFGITSEAGGKVVTKVKRNGQADKSQIFFIDLPRR